MIVVSLLVLIVLFIRKPENDGDDNNLRATEGGMGWGAIPTATTPNPAYNQRTGTPPTTAAKTGGAGEYAVAVTRNPEYQYAPPLNPPRGGSGKGNSNQDYAEVAAALDVDGYVLDETAAAPSIVYASYAPSTEVAGGGGGGGGARGGGYELPVAEYVDLTEKDYAAMYGDHADANCSVVPATPVVAVSAGPIQDAAPPARRPTDRLVCSRGRVSGGRTCSKPATAKSCGRFCAGHTCNRKGCTNTKSSADDVCEQHRATTSDAGNGNAARTRPPTAPRGVISSAPPPGTKQASGRTQHTANAQTKTKAASSTNGGGSGSGGPKSGGIRRNASARKGSTYDGFGGGGGGGSVAGSVARSVGGKIQRSALEGSTYDGFGGDDDDGGGETLV